MSARPTLFVAILGSTMAFLDASVVNVALPVIQHDLHATVDVAQWIVESYALFLASLVLVGGALGDRLGRKRIFSAGVVLFALASVGCGLAPTAAILVVARAIQGMGGALLVPGSLSLITAAYPDATARGRAIGIWSMFTSIIAAVGPIAGGFVVEHASWRWVFIFNVPVAVLILAIAHGGVTESRDDDAPKRMDWIGAALVTAGLGAITFGLIDNRMWVVGVGGAFLVGFVAFEARTSSPMVPLALFRERTFAGANLLTLMLYGALGGIFFFLPFDLIQVQGYTPAKAGAALLPFILAMSVLSPLMGSLSAKVGARVLLVAGSIVCAIGYALLCLPGRGGSYWTSFFPGIATLGIGMGLVVAPLTTAVMGSVPGSHSGIASGVNNAVARAAGLIAIAALGLVLRGRFDRTLDDHLPDFPPAARAVAVSERDKLVAADLSAIEDAGTRDAVHGAFADAYVTGFRALMIASAILSALGALAAAVSLRKAARASLVVFALVVFTQSARADEAIEIVPYAAVRRPVDDVSKDVAGAGVEWSDLPAAERTGWVLRFGGALEHHDQFEWGAHARIGGFWRALQLELGILAYSTGDPETRKPPPEVIVRPDVVARAGTQTSFVGIGYGSFTPANLVAPLGYIQGQIAYAEGWTTTLTAGVDPWRFDVAQRYRVTRNLRLGVGLALTHGDPSPVGSEMRLTIEWVSPDPASPRMRR